MLLPFILKKKNETKQNNDSVTCRCPCIVSVQWQQETRAGAAAEEVVAAPAH